MTGKAGAFKVISRRYSYHGATAMAVSLGRSPAADPCGPEMPGAIHVTNWDSYRLPFDGDPVDVAIRCANEFEVAIKTQRPRERGCDDCRTDLGGGGGYTYHQRSIGSGCERSQTSTMSC